MTTRLDTTGASNFYYYGKPTDEVPKTPYPLGQEISTQFPATVAKIRLVAIFAFTAFAGFRFAQLLAATRIASFSKSYSALFVPAAFLAAHTAYKHLFTKDPLVEAFYKIAGGENEYNNLPEIKLDPTKKTSQTLRNQLSWNALEHPVYRLTTSDGRKGMVIKGLSYSKKKGSLLADVLPSAHTQRTLFLSRRSIHMTSHKDRGYLRECLLLLLALILNVGKTHFLKLYPAVLGIPKSVELLPV